MEALRQNAVTADTARQMLRYSHLLDWCISQQKWPHGLFNWSTKISELEKMALCRYSEQ
jgi:hypothetical protein